MPKKIELPKKSPRKNKRKTSTKSPTKSNPPTSATTPTSTTNDSFDLNEDNNTASVSPVKMKLATEETLDKSATSSPDIIQGITEETVPFEEPKDVQTPSPKGQSQTGILEQA